METSTDDSADPASPQDVTELILRIFRLNGALLAAGDRLVGDLRLTSARWQVLGGIAAEEDPLPVAQLARKMGVTRQAVQRIANELAAEGVVAFRINPRHKRAQLVELTDSGRVLFERAMALQRPWASTLGRSLTASQVREAYAVMEALLVALNQTASTRHTPEAALGPSTEQDG